MAAAGSSCSPASRGWGSRPCCASRPISRPSAAWRCSPAQCAPEPGAPPLWCWTQLLQGLQAEQDNPADLDPWLVAHLLAPVGRVRAKPRRGGPEVPAVGVRRDRAAAPGPGRAGAAGGRRTAVGRRRLGGAARLLGPAAGDVGRAAARHVSGRRGRLRAARGGGTSRGPHPAGARRGGGRQPDRPAPGRSARTGAGGRRPGPG